MKTLTIVAALGIAAAGAGEVAAQDTSTKTIVEVAVEAGSFNTLVQAVQAAGLVETLNSAGPFTVFAPTDEAFAKLPAGTLEALLADREALASVLTYHVLPGKVMAADVMQARQVRPETVQGQTLNVRVMGSSVMVNDATVVQADIGASNGVIHVIDTVILPPSMREK